MNYQIQQQIDLANEELDFQFNQSQLLNEYQLLTLDK